MGCQWIERKCNFLEMVAKGNRTRDLSIASLAFYRNETVRYHWRDCVSGSLLSEGWICVADSKIDGDETQNRYNSTFSCNL